ncbi:hypothetical protein A3D42_02685 [Candidatus Nomurabacteria bacterium RIFCSPHIGHO2_02_FULL_41_18]|uniref:Cytochrome C biogenesis protein CcdA n=1 Tax=Candidatus Nomurabacteria bacterium RIFCSPHIGHO2_02_FULL_41_18 TaxID=1801754 RepID=A0A1F6W871_9BACT|nr:MAG: hypothetical protein A3D42_02685 [Candidatus Nomurabacteria bacterium RIFCSPHIGHO2_02_FULL_41_18]
MVSLYITCKNLEEGEKIGEAVMNIRAAGCINMFPTQSVWRNDETDSLEKHEEVVLIVKTLESKVQEIEDLVRKVGSYKAPCIASLTVSRINREYKEWLGRVVV